jgi:hypothetical protein
MMIIFITVATDGTLQKLGSTMKNIKIKCMYDTNFQ